MTEVETIKIMAMLGAFYSSGKNDPKTQAKAWHLLIGEYDYEVVKRAVLNYAKNDVREYASFPAVGVIIAEIKKIDAEMEKPIKEIIHRVLMGLDYHGLSIEGQKLISEEQYNEWLRVNAEEFANHTKDYADILRRRRDGYGGGDAIAVTSNVMKRLESGF